MKLNIADIAKKVLPEATVTSLVRAKKRLDRTRITRLPQLSERDFTEILVNHLRLTAGDTVFVHSSVDRLNLDFPFYRILALLRDVIGERGTLLSPTYPNHKISSYEYLQQDNVFDVRRTPSYIGLLTEFARRQPGAVRSLHPTKSVSAIGPLAEELTRTHQHSPYPYDKCSPFYKLTECNAKIVGLGAGIKSLSFTYCVADVLKESFPVRLYHPQIFKARCINYQGEMEIVETYAQDMSVVSQHDAPAFMKTYVDEDICSDLIINGMSFFRADAARLFDAMLRLAEKGITVYPKSAYSKDWRARLSL